MTFHDTRGGEFHGHLPERPECDHVLVDTVLA